MILGICDQHVRGYYDIWCLQISRCFEAVAITIKGEQCATVVEVISISKWQSELPGQLSAVNTRAKQQHGWRAGGFGCGCKAIPHAVFGNRVAQQTHNINDVLREVFNRKGR